MIGENPAKIYIIETKLVSQQPSGQAHEKKGN